MHSFHLVAVRVLTPCRTLPPSTAAAQAVGGGVAVSSVAAGAALAGGGGNDGFVQLWHLPSRTPFLAERAPACPTAAVAFAQAPGVDASGEVRAAADWWSAA